MSIRKRPVCPARPATTATSPAGARRLLSLKSRETHCFRTFRTSSDPERGQVRALQVTPALKKSADIQNYGGFIYLFITIGLSSSFVGINLLFSVS